ncbi:MAG: SMI1/KNR4 family protein [Janthinobacterium lividum]
MTALEKVRFLKEIKWNKLYLDKYFIDISVEENRWQPGEIDELQQQYPWLSQFYLDFIAEFDAVGVAWVVFYGSRNCDVIPIWEEIDYWKDQAKDQYLPFGKDPSGSIYVFDRQNKVLLFSLDDEEWENPEVHADSLEEFIDQCLLGPQYAEFNSIEKDNFYRLLKDQGWV